jgi:hypothetical protein
VIPNYSCAVYEYANQMLTSRNFMNVGVNNGGAYSRRWRLFETSSLFFAKNVAKTDITFQVDACVLKFSSLSSQLNNPRLYTTEAEVC